MAESQLERLRATMDKLRSPGGCPWDAEQTHETLLKYLLEESYEFIDAVEKGDRVEMREELGDVLLQVFFHARMAEESGSQPFGIEDVAEGVADKLIRRHPHVFGDVVATTSADVLENWEAIKKEEKGRTSATDGVPMGQPALPLAAKVLYRAEKYGYEIPIEHQANLDTHLSQESAGRLLLGLIDQIQALGIDPEAALRAATKEYIAKIHAHEANSVTR
ncbi:MAG: MazG family protein [Actinomycetes bacterium]